MDSQTTTQEDLQYLVKEDIGKIIAEGLTVLQEKQPKHPVTYLSSWLLNYCAEQTNTQKEKEREEFREAQIKKEQQRLEELQKQQHQKELEAKNQQTLEDGFFKAVSQHLYHDEMLDNELPQFLKDKLNIPAVYVGLNDYPKKPITYDDEEPDAHIDMEKPKSIRYIGASNNQRFMVGKELESEKGITYDCFKEAEPSDAGGGDDDEEGNEPAEKKNPKLVYVPDVTERNEIIYFRIPKLGGFVAYSLLYQSVLNQEAFDEGVKERLRYQEEKADLEAQKKEAEDEFQDALDNADGDTQAGELQEEWNNREWPEAFEADFKAIPKEYVLCADTLGEDRGFTEEELKYIEKVAEHFVKSWEESEKAQLSKDINDQIALWKDFDKDDYFDNVQARIDEEAAELAGQDEIEGEETEIQETYRKAKHVVAAYRTAMREDDVKGKLLYVKSYRVVKYMELLQEASILCGIKREEMNIPGTNILNWKKFREQMTEDIFIKRLEEYTFEGVKKDPVVSYAKLGRIKRRLEKIVVEEIEEYNAGFAILLKYLKQLIETRFLDILSRKEAKQIKRKAREQAMEDEENRQKEKEEDIEAQKQEWDDEENEFDEEQARKEYDERFPPYEIPEEVEDDIDEDIDPEDLEEFEQKFNAGEQ